MDNFLRNLEKATKAQRKGDLKKAEKLFKIALRREPHHPLVNTALGTLYIQKEMYGHAAKLLHKALVTDPTLSEPINNLAVALRNLGDEEQALEILEDGVKKFPEDTNMFCNAGSLAFTMGEWDKAEKYLRHSIALKEDHNDAHWNLGLCLLTQAKYEEGWQEYDWGLRAGERVSRPYWNEYPEWLGEDLEGKTLLIWGEQGLGDEILFSSCIQFLEKTNIIFDCHPRLLPIFQRSYPDIHCVGARKDEDWGWLNHHEIDHFIPIGSLPGMFPGQFPEGSWLKADKKDVSKWKKRLGKKPKIGISWQGGSRKNASARRSMPLAKIMDKIKHHDVQWVSLQYTDCYNELADFAKSTGIQLLHDPYAIENYDETAALVSSLDLIITVCTSAGHLAGSLGVPTWVMCPQASPWRWPLGETHPWYASVKQYHQNDRHDWEPVLERVAKDLEAFLA